MWRRESRAGLTSAIVGEIDPASKEAQAKKDAEQLKKARQAFEAALVAAETAIVAYEAATTDAASPGRRLPCLERAPCNR